MTHNSRLIDSEILHRAGKILKQVTVADGHLLGLFSDENFSQLRAKRISGARAAR